MISENLDYTDIHAVLITHSHEDHLEPCDVTYRRPGFANKLDGDRPMTVYGNGKVMQVLEKYSVGPWQNKKQTNSNKKLKGCKPNCKRNEQRKRRRLSN